MHLEYLLLDEVIHGVELNRKRLHGSFIDTVSTTRSLPQISRVNFSLRRTGNDWRGSSLGLFKDTVVELAWRN
jgi:hypothetical protein